MFSTAQAIEKSNLKIFLSRAGSEDMGLNSTRWCDGLRLAERKRLSEDEAVDLRVKIASARRRLKWDKWTRRLAFWLASLSLLVSIFSGIYLGENHIGLTGFSLGAAIFFPAGIGVLLEITFGYNKKSRWIFSAACGALLAGLLINYFDTESQLSEGLIATSAFILILGGWASLLLRWNDTNELGPALELAHSDSESAEILEFTGANDETVSGKLELLPLSNLAYRINGAFVKDWEIHKVVTISTSQEEILDAPWYDGPENTIDGGKYFQRHLGEDEIQELGKLSSKMVRKAIGSLFGYTWFAAIILRAVENLRNHSVTLSGYGWIIAGLVGLYFCGKYLRQWHRLKLDIEKGLMVKFQDKDGAIYEFLPLSSIMWSSAGIPSPWRTSWW